MTEEEEWKAIKQALKALYARGNNLGLPQAMLTRVASVQTILEQFYPNIT